MRRLETVIATCHILPISLASANSTSSVLTGTNYSVKHALGYDIYTDSTMDAYADHENPYWKLSMKYGGSQQSFEAAVDSLCTHKVFLATTVPADTLTDITILVLASPKTMGTTALIAAFLAIRIVVASKKLIMVVSLIALLIMSIFVISIIFHARSITSISLLTLVSYDMLIFTLAIIRMIMFSKSILYKFLFILCLIIILSAHILYAILFAILNEGTNL